MKPITHQVEEFIEGFFDGSIITVLNQDMDMSKPSIGLTILSAGEGKIGELLGELVTKLIPQYVIIKEGEEPQRQDTAYKIFQYVMRLRMVGTVRNNSESLKELQFYRSRVTNAEERVGNLQGQLKEAYQMIQSLELRLDDKEKGKHPPGTT